MVLSATFAVLLLVLSLWLPKFLLAGPALGAPLFLLGAVNTIVAFVCLLRKELGTTDLVALLLAVTYDGMLFTLFFLRE
jgi:hypothetical protein